MYAPKSFVLDKNIQPTNNWKPRSFVPEKRTLGGFATNVVKSGGRFLGDVGNALIHPVKTAKSLLGLGAGVVEKAIPGRQAQEKYADAVGNFYKQRYGGKDEILRSLYHDPVGVAGDVSVVARGLGAGAKLAGEGSKLANIGSRLSEISKATDPLQAIGRASKAVSKPIESVAEALKKRVPTSSEFVTSGLGNPSAQRKMIVPAEEIIPKYKLWARTEDVATEALGKLGEQRTQAVKKSGAFGNLQDLLKPLDEEILAMKNDPNYFRGGNINIPLSPEASKRLAQLIENRNNIVKRFAETEGNATNINPEVSVADIDAFRRQSIDPNIPQGAFAKKLSQTPAKDTAYKQTRTALKRAIDKKAGTKQIGKDMQSIYQLKNKVFPGYQSRVANRQKINVHKLGSAFAGGMVGGVPGAIAGFALEQFMNSPQGAEVMYKALKIAENKPFSKMLTKSQAITNITKELRKLNIPNPAEVAQQMYKYAKLGRMVK